jgi:hypothetical protein
VTSASIECHGAIYVLTGVGIVVEGRSDPQGIDVSHDGDDESCDDQNRGIPK